MSLAIVNEYTFGWVCDSTKRQRLNGVTVYLLYFQRMNRPWLRWTCNVKSHKKKFEGIRCTYYQHSMLWPYTNHFYRAKKRKSRNWIRQNDEKNTVIHGQSSIENGKMAHKYIFWSKRYDMVDFRSVDKMLNSLCDATVATR